MMDVTTLLAWGSLTAFLVMLGLWLVQKRTGNAGIVDLGWSATIPLLVTLAAIFGRTGMETNSVSVMRSVLAVMLCGLWGGRLAWHIHRRSHGQPEDRRYATLRSKWGEKAQSRFFWFFQFQAAAAVLFALPYVVIVRHGGTQYYVLELVGLAVWVLAWTGEVTADAQLAAFKRNEANRGRVCDAGLWRYSRHPNYFFEWLIWCAVATAALPAPLGPVALICPALMLFFLFKVTGIPATEEQALRSKGDAYREYQRTTSVFVPWFKRKA